MSGSPNIVAFRKAAHPPCKRKGPPPVTVRLSQAEYDRLKHDAGVLTMAAYIRLTLFGEGEIAPHRKPYTRKATSPSAELTMIGKMLGGLGQSEIAASLADIAGAAKIGALPLSPDVEAAITEACAAVQDMRTRLIAALGVKVQ
ncbi:MAG: hypothetical protein GC191_12945 [Azospirillum sp.]|nr:hypothetical protein [Azospirillum sp.]